MSKYKKHPRNKSRMATAELQDAYDAHMEWLDHLTDTGCNTGIGKQMVLEDENLTDCDFFSNKNLGRVVFRNCILDRVNFIESDLSSALLQDCLLNETCFDYATLTCTFDHCAGNNTMFRYANLAEAEIKNMRIYEGDFRNCKANNARIIGGILNKCQFNSLHAQNSHWESVYLSDCNLHWADLQGAEIHNCRIGNCNCNTIDLSYSEICNGTYVNKCDFRKADLTCAKMKDCEFFDCTMNRARFGNTDALNTIFDLSSFPLWCGTLHIKTDDRLPAQLLYHLARLNTENMSGGMKETIEQIRQMAASDLFCEYRNDLEED